MCVSASVVLRLTFLAYVWFIFLSFLAHSGTMVLPAMDKVVDQVGLRTHANRFFMARQWRLVMPVGGRG